MNALVSILRGLCRLDRGTAVDRKADVYLLYTLLTMLCQGVASGVWMSLGFRIMFGAILKAIVF